jgi:sugar lactone lactonase YvrE
MPEPRILLDDLVFVESPRWHQGRLWFSDWVAGQVIAVDDDGHREDVLAVHSAPFSIDWLPDGRLLVVAGSDRRLLRQERDGSLVTHADLGPVCAYPWNEIVVDGRANIYVNSIGYDMMAGEPPAEGVVALVTPDGSVREVADGVLFPNGMAVTSDDRTLIVAESHGQRLTAFDIDGSGGLANRRVWADLGDGAPDGICLDAEGAVWYADVPHQRCVRVREGGEVLQEVVVDRGCFACMLGGPRGTTLYVLAAVWQGADGMTDAHTGQVLTVEVEVPHAGRP